MADDDRGTGGVGVSPNSAVWQIDGTTLFESTDPNEILFASWRPRLVLGDAGRYQLAISLFPAADGINLASGSALVTVTCAIHEPERRTREWREALAARGLLRAREVRFALLPQREERIALWLDPSLGVARPEADVGELAGKHSFLLALTASGAAAIDRCVRERAPISGTIEASSEYPRRTPAGWSWQRHGESAPLAHLLGVLDASYLHRVTAEQPIPITLTVVGDPAVRRVAVSWTASEGMVPRPLTFGPDGGTASALVSTREAAKVRVRCVARIQWVAPRRPVTVIEQERPLLDGGAHIVIRPSFHVETG